MRVLLLLTIAVARYQTLSIDLSAFSPLPIALAPSNIPLYRKLFAAQASGPFDKCFDYLNDAIAKGIEIAKLCAQNNYDATYDKLGPFLHALVNASNCFDQSKLAKADKWECIIDHLQHAYDHLLKAADYLSDAKFEEAFGELKTAFQLVQDIQNC